MSEENIKELLYAIQSWDDLFTETFACGQRIWDQSLVGPSELDALLDARHRVKKAVVAVKIEQGIPHEEP